MEDKKNETNGTIQLFTEALFSDDLRDLSTDIAEIALDTLLEENTILREIPLVKTAIAMFKAGASIQTSRM